MSEIKVKTIEPSTGTNLTLGASGDTVAVSSDSVKLDIWKDSGGNTLFQSDGAGTLSNVNSTFSGAGPKLILSQTADDSALVNFTANIDSTYDEYWFVILEQNPENDSTYFSFQGSIDGGSNYNVTMTTTYFRASHNEAGTESALGYIAASDNVQDTRYLPLYQSGVGTAGSQTNQADAGLAGILKLYAPSNTTYVKHFMALTNGCANDIGSKQNYIGGYFNTTSAINAISFKQSVANFSGKIKMYGVT